MKNKQTSNWHSVQSQNAIYIRALNHPDWHTSTNSVRFEIYLETLCEDFESDILPLDPIEKSIKSMALKEAKASAKQTMEYDRLCDMKPQREWFYDNFWEFLDLADEELREDAPLQSYEYEDNGPICSIL